jgi:mRNA-binding protein PUF3
VVEKSIKFGSDEQRKEIIKIVTTLRADGSSPLRYLMPDQYANYVIREFSGVLLACDIPLTLRSRIAPHNSRRH